MSTPLLEKEKKEETVTFQKAACKVAKLAYMPLIGMLCHPMYTMVNAAFLGHEETTYPLSGFGLGSLTLGICMLSIGSSFAMGMGTFVSQAHGQQDPRLCRVYLHR
jgi:Na+-driven multidrug efflux pump